MSAKTSSYQPHIDGLRAIAILSVVFYHAGLGCPGGYVGVDVFFVISGYLITSLILKDLREDNFSLVNFWERRLRRIFPALAATVLLTLLAGWFLLLPDDLEKLGKSTIAQGLLSANFYFWRTDNYFGGANEDKPLLHTWSLAVEEQFYLFFPLVLVWLFRRAEFRRPHVLVSLLLAGLAASLLVAVWGVKHQPYATFFLLPTRAWELGCGALVAVLAGTTVPASRRVREATSWLGLAGIFLPVWLYHDNTPFPGLAALPPCLGTGLLIWANSTAANTGMPATPRTLPAVCLSWPAATFIGLISYSLYLWHWPVMAFSNYWKTALFSQADRWGLVVVSFTLAVLSWRCIETPFRNRSICGTRRGIFLLVSGVSSLSLICSGSLILSDGFPARIPPAALAVVQAVAQNADVWKQYSAVDGNIKNISEVRNDRLKSFGSTNPDAPLKFLVLGDSHAGCSIPIFDRLGREHGVAGAAITYQGTPPVFGWKQHFRHAASNPDQLWRAALEYAKRNHVSHVFLVAYWSNYQRAVGAGQLEQSLADTIKLFQASGVTVWVVLDNPTYEGDVVKALVRKTLFPQLAPQPGACTEADHLMRNSALYALWKKEASPRFLDPAPFFLDPQNGTFVVTQAGVPLYFDHDHLTLRGEEIGLLPLLQPIFEKELTPARLSGNTPARL